MKHRHTSLLTAACALLLASGLNAAIANDNIASNGDFEKVDANGAAANWPMKAGITYPQENGNRFLRVESVEAGKTVMAYREFTLPKNAAALKLTMRARWSDVVVGEKSWFDARVMMEFKDINHATVKGAPGAPNFKGTSAEWVTREMLFEVPSGAFWLAFMPSMFNAKSGRLELDDITLTAVSADEFKRIKSAEANAKAAAAYAAIIWSKTMPVPADAKTAPLKVQGNRLVSMKDGKEVWLQGVAIASMEWSAGGEHILESVDHSINVWGVNAIRLAVKSPFWFGTSQWQKDSGIKYRELVDQVVEKCQRAGVYLVLDLHEYRAASGQHAHFWRDAATRYKNHPGVIFGLLNEPHGISWEEWRNGGSIAAKGGEKAGVISENQENLGAVESVGMQYLVDVVRKTGAKNLLSAGGLDWAYDLSGILEGFALTDTKDGQGIMYETHVYVWKSGWQKRFLDAAEKYPLLVGEVGCQPERMSFIPPENHEMPETWAPDMLGCIQKYRLNWTAWCFHPKSSPCLISDWDYTPTPYWGEPVMRALKGEKFEMKKMR